MEEKPNLPSAGGTGEPSKGKTPVQGSPATRPADGLSAPQKEGAPIPAVYSPANGKIEPLYQELLYSKRFWLWVVLLGFLLYTMTMVPVAKIPFLRTLVEAMGYTEPETHQVSFFKALLTWNEHTKTRQAQAAEDLEARTSTANAVSGALESARQNARSGLLDLGEVSRVLNAQGKADDTLVQVKEVDATDTKEAQLVQMSGRETKVTTQQSQVRGSASAPQIGEQDISSEVFFGEDKDQIARDPDGGFDSTKTLAGVEVPGTIDSVPTDWKLEQADSFWDRHRHIVFNNKLFKVGDVGHTRGLDMETVADIKPRADVVYSWMTSRAARRVRNTPLKQTLTKAGFMGADLSRPMLITAVDGTGVLPMDTKRMRMDFNVAQDRIELEKQCSEAIEQKDQIIFDNIRAAKAEQEKLAGYMKTCGDVLGNGYKDFIKGLDKIKKSCDKARDTYNSFKRTCRMEIIEGTCDNGVLTFLAQRAQEFCAEQMNACALNQDPAAAQACKQNVNAMPPQIGENAMEDVIDWEMNYRYDPEHPEKKSYFSEIDWAGTLRNRRYQQEL